LTDRLKSAALSGCKDADLEMGKNVHGPNWRKLRGSPRGTIEITLTPTPQVSKIHARHGLRLEPS
jgi:hypothetical protein